MSKFLTFLLTFLFLISKSAISSPTKAKLIITGSSTLAPMIAELAKSFESKHPQVRIDVQSGGSSRGINDTREKVADIGMVSRALRDEENDLRGFTIAWDGICLILHQDNPIIQLTRQQIRDIYLGRITRWHQLGWSNSKIIVLSKAEGRSTLELFKKYFDLRSKDIKADVIIGENEQAIKMVSQNPYAMGYVSIGNAEYDQQHGAAIRLLPLEGIPATTASVKQKKFPIARPLTLVTKNIPNGIKNDFIQFVLSKESAEIIRQQYFVPVIP